MAKPQRTRKCSKTRRMYSTECQKLDMVSVASQSGAMNDPIDNRILYALFGLSRNTLPTDVAALAEATELSPLVVGQALVRLEEAGLVDASRARLTMTGLAKAVSLTRDLSGTAPGPALTQSRAPSEALPMAAVPAHRQNAS